MSYAPLLLTTAGAIRYVRYSAAELAVLMVKHRFPVPVCRTTDRDQNPHWDSRELDRWLEERLGRLVDLGF